MKYLFIDESGDHNLVPEKIDPQFPLFVLTGIVFDSKEYKKFQKKLFYFKQKIFGTEKIILHSKELTRPKLTKQKQLVILTNKTKRASFYTELDQVFAEAHFSIISFVIDKPWFEKKLGAVPPDPYFLSFSYVLSKYEELLGKREHGKVFAEQRGKFLDKKFLLAWESSRVTRVGLVKREKLDIHHIAQPEILRKSWEYAGLELADLVSYRLSRHFMNKSVKPKGNEIDVRMLGRKQMLVGSFTGLPNMQEK